MIVGVITNLKHCVQINRMVYGTKMVVKVVGTKKPMVKKVDAIVG